MTSSFKEITRMPKFILILFGIQLAVFLLLFIKNDSYDLEIFYILIPVTFLLIFAKMEIFFDKEHIRYKLFPLHISYKEIEWTSIEEIQIVKIDALSDFLGWGLRYSKRFGWGYIFNSNDALFITLKNNKKITITIKDKDKLIAFLKENKISFRI